MKRNFASKPFLVLLIIMTALISTSCSSLLSRRAQTVDSFQQGESAVPTTMVPKEQYDELARKYQELLNQSKQMKSGSLAEATTPNTSAQASSETQAKPETATATSLDPSELVNHIDKAIPDTANVDSVDALKPEIKSEKMAGPAVPASMGVEHVNMTDDIDEQISRLREVQELVKVNKFEGALTLLKELENSKEKQIVVRAKMMLGDLLFNQGEFDLASQVYEEVIKKYAFSGYVLKALGKLVACSEKLKQPEKQAKYYSLLHDFFEAA